MTTKPSRTSSDPAFPARYPAGSVVVVPFPYADRLSEKRRPAVVVSVPELERRGYLWVLMITTARRGEGPLDVRIDDPDAAGLRTPCVVRPTKIACIEPSRVARRAGALTPEIAGRVFARAVSLIASRPPDR